jgi:threonylcarbamoyladenosine tRNA methylthiotransferase MtaB
LTILKQQRYNFYVMAESANIPAIALDSLGCKLNQAEIQYLAAQLARAGYRIVDSPEKADIYILNTCTVTHIADRKSRHLLRLVRRRHPAVRLVAIGCYAHRSPQELERIKGVDLVLGNDRKMELLSLLEDARILSRPDGAVSRPENDARRNRAFLKVQDGCHNFCAYCIVPHVRTREVSVPVSEIVSRVKEKSAAGFQEVVLTGTEIGTYRCDGTDLARLLKHILDETDIGRVRLSSLQPPEISERLVGLWRDPRLCPHFHLSLQSGSDDVLKRMKRRYTTTDYLRVVALIRHSVPDVAITTDVIVAFPGETDTEFKETLEFCRDLKFARIHVFPFSPRPGTLAAAMPDRISAAVKKERSQIMLSLAKESARGFQQKFLGRTLEVLWERLSGGIWSGLTGNYIRVYARSSEDMTNKLLPVKLTKIYRDGVWG